MADFATALAPQVESLPKWSIRYRIMNNILSRPDDDPKKQAALLVLEHHARKAHRLTDDAEVDWSASTINWAQILALIVQLLPILIQILSGA